MKFLNGQLQLDSSLTGTTALFTSGLTVSTGASSGGITLQQNGILIAELRRVGNNNRSGLFLTNSGTVEIQFDTGSFSYIRSNNFGIGTATDAGYKLDVNGTARVNGILTVGSDVQGKISANNVYLNLYHQGGSLSTISLGFTSGAGGYLLINQNGGDSAGTTSGTVHRYDFNSSITNSSGNAEWNFQSLRPTYNFTGTYSGIVRGFYYSPTLTSLSGTTHRAIETVTGDVILGSTSGNVGIGTSTLGTSTELTVGGGQAASSAIARGQLLNTTLTATSNNDVLVGLDVAPTFTNGAFTGVTNFALRVAYSSNRFISFTQRPGYADYGRIQFTNVTGADIYSSSRIDLLPNDTSQSVGLGNNITSQRLASSTNWGLYGPTASGFLVGSNAAFGILSNNADVNTDSFVFAGPTGSRHFFKVVQNDVPYFTIVPTGNVLINTTTDLGFKLSVSGSTLLRGSGTTSASYALATQNSSGGTTMVVNNAGNMLIGTTTDNGYRLNVNGSINISGGNKLNFSNGSAQCWITNEGQTGLGSRSILIPGTGGGGGFVFYSDAGGPITSFDGSGDSIQIMAGSSAVTGIMTINKSAASGYGGGTFIYYQTNSNNRMYTFGNPNNERGDESGTHTKIAAGSAGFLGNGGHVYLESGPAGTQVGSVNGNIIIAETRGNVLIGTSTTNNSRLLVGGTVSGATLSTTRAVHINPTLLATGNTTTLIGLDIQPNFNRSSFTGTTALALRVSGGTQIIGSGSTGTTLSVFSVDGSSGRLFDVSDDLSSTLFSVNTIAGLPVIEAFANNAVVMGKYNQNTLVVSGTSVGIGTSSPQAKLDVSGTSIFRTGVTMNSSLILGNVDITSAWSAYTPTWTAISSNPSIGNGTISGTFKVIGKTCFVRGRITMGSSTTYGSGAWLIGLPLPAINSYAIQITSSLLNNGNAWYSGLMNGGRFGNTSYSEIQVQNTSGTADGISSTYPFTWGDTDELSFNGSYEIA
jgi:hypothetical protein